MPRSDPSRSSAGARAGAVGIGANLMLFLGKLIAGTLSGSVSVTADAMNNLSDAGSSLVTLLGFKLAGKPADQDHPYGHARYEYLSGLAVAAMILFIGFELAKASVSRIIHPAAVVFDLVTVLVLIGSITVKLGLWLYYRHLGRKLRSEALLATAADSRNDCVATGAVLLSALVQRFAHWQVDGWMGLGVAVFILYSGIFLAKTTISPLLGEAAGPELREQILDEIRAQPLVLGYHDLMVHDYGPDRRFASIHVEMDSRRDPLQCHEIIDRLERECYESHGIHLVIHYDPVLTDDPEQERVKSLAQKALEQIDPRLGLHDLRLLPDRTEVRFDIALPTDLEKARETIQSRLDAALAPYHATITFDPEAFDCQNG